MRQVITSIHVANNETVLITYPYVKNIAIVNYHISLSVTPGLIEFLIT